MSMDAFSAAVGEQYNGQLIRQTVLNYNLVTNWNGGVPERLAKRQLRCGITYIVGCDSGISTFRRADFERIAEWFGIVLPAKPTRKEARAAILRDIGYDRTPPERGEFTKDELQAVLAAAVRRDFGTPPAEGNE